MTIVILIVWSILNAFLAKHFRRSVLGWFLVSLLLSPAFPTIALLVIRYPQQKAKKSTESTIQEDDNVPSEGQAEG